MLKRLVKIYSKTSVSFASINTSEGIKKVQRDSTGRYFVEGSENLAKQMIDDVNWEFEDAEEELEEDEEDVEEEDEEEKEEKEKEAEVVEKETDEYGIHESEKGTVGDDEVRVLLKSIPRIRKRERLEEIAIELGVNHEEFTSDSKLKTELLKVIKGS